VRTITAFALLALLTAATSANGQTSSARPATTSVRCDVRAHLVGSLHQTGGLAGSVKCGHPLGKGSYSGRYQDDVTHWPTVTETGSSKLAFKSGTLRGTYQLGPALVSTLVPYHGKFHITGGTGRLKHVKGTLHLRCAHRIPPLTHCTLSGSVSGI
jgi:hypothetical protein